MNSLPIVLGILSVSVLLVAAQIPQRCEAPPAWVGHISRTEVEFERGVQIRGRIAYDKLNERYRILQQYEFRNRDSDFFAGRYYFFKEKLEYRANFTSKRCERRYLNETFQPLSIPDIVSYVDTIELGTNAAPGEGVEVQIWEGQTPGGGFVSGMWIANGCLPLSEQFRRGNFYTSSYFYDIKEGYNPDDFVPPEFCQ